MASLQGAGPESGYMRCLFENPRVRVLDFRLPPSAEVTWQASLPTVRWQVDQGTHVLATGEGVEVEGTGPDSEVQVPDKEVFFVEAGKTWRLRNVGKESYRQVLFEIRQPPKYSEAEIQQLLSRAIYPTEVGTKLLFENHLCRVWDFYLEPGEGDYEKPHHHVMDYVFVYVEHGRLLGSTHDGKPGLFDSINDDGAVTWFDIPYSAAEDPNYAHGGKNGYEDRPMREYLVELK